MISMAPDFLPRRESTASAIGNCVEVWRTGEAILVRDSQNPRQHLAFTRREWEAFLAGARAGEFDPDRLPG